MLTAKLVSSSIDLFRFCFFLVFQVNFFRLQNFEFQMNFKHKACAVKTITKLTNSIQLFQFDKGEKKISLVYESLCGKNKMVIVNLIDLVCVFFCCFIKTIKRE